VNQLFQDVRHGVRGFVKTPGFAAVAVATLALGIGANTAIFSVVNAVLIRPLPYPSSERLITVWNKYPKMGLSRASISGPDFVDRSQSSRVFERFGVFTDASLNLTGDGNPERIRGIRASAGLFQVLGIQPALGRTFLPEEDRPGAEPVVLVSHGLFERRFGGDRAWVGRPILLNGKSHTLVGVMPDGFAYPSPQTEMWVPLALSADQVNPSQRGNEYLAAVARLKPGVTPEAAQAEMDRITGKILRESPPSMREYLEGAGWGCVLVPLKESVIGDSGKALLVLLGAVGFVLLVACANVSGLQLARAATRQREIAIRTALGAGRWRLIRQLLTESLMLCAVGGILGVLVAAWGVDLLIRMQPANLPRLEEVSLDSRVLLFSAALSILAAMLSGLAPALRLSRTSPNEALKEGGRSATGGLKHLRVQRLMVVSQVALALVLLVGAGLMLRSFESLLRVDAGFDPKNVLTAYVSLPPSRYPDPETMRAFFDRLLEKLEAPPGVKSVATSSLVPLVEGNWTASFFAEGQEPGRGEASPLASMRLVSPGSFRTLGIPLLQGRDFTDHDDPKSPGVVVVDAGAARRLWPGENPLGKRITFSDSAEGAAWLSVVGVAGDIKDAALDREPMIHVYRPYAQQAIPGMFVTLRTESNPAGILPAFKQELRLLDPDQPLYAVRTMQSYVQDSLAQPRLRFILIALFASVALLLSALGVYAVISHSVGQRIQEIGIRMALGARRGDVVRLILGQGLPLVLLGACIGFIAALGLTRVLESLLYGVTAHDPATFAAVSALLVLVALAACYLPARRAARVDPLTALRIE
jgi:putative ABC transport system permease protein